MIKARSEDRPARQVKLVVKALLREYGSPRLGNPKGVLDDLVFIILSNRTNNRLARRVYKSLKQTYRPWDALAGDDIRNLRKVIKEAGLSVKKSRQIKSSLRSVYADFGRNYTRRLRDMSDGEVERYLKALPGVSAKVAKCIMLYTLGRKVLPVDVHVHRITKRLGWIAQKRADQSHEILEGLVPPDMRFSFHVDCVVHGRKICRPRKPLCEVCVIKGHCNYYKAGN